MRAFVFSHPSRKRRAKDGAPPVCGWVRGKAGPSTASATRTPPRVTTLFFVGLGRDDVGGWCSPLKPKEGLNGAPPGFWVGMDRETSPLKPKEGLNGAPGDDVGGWCSPLKP